MCWSIRKARFWYTDFARCSSQVRSADAQAGRISDRKFRKRRRTGLLSIDFDRGGQDLVDTMYRARSAASTPRLGKGRLLPRARNGTTTGAAHFTGLRHDVDGRSGRRASARSTSFRVDLKDRQMGSAFHPADDLPKATRPRARASIR